MAFLWSFPSFTIIGSHNRDSDTGDILFDDDLRFATPEVTPGGEQRIAIFTDAGLAEDFRLTMPNPQTYRLGRFSTAAQLRDFLHLAKPFYARVVVDLNHKTWVGRHFPIPDLIAEIDRHLASQEDQGDHT